MLLLNNFDPFEDFWATNPQLRILFKEEYDAKVPSSQMWAVALFVHPSSKLFNESPENRKKLILSDYLNDPSFDFDSLSPTIDKFKRLVLTKAELLLSNWEKRMYDREAFLDSVPYSPDTFDMIEKMVKETPKLWQNLFQIQTALSKEQDTKVEGDIEESLSEKGLLD